MTAGLALLRLWEFHFLELVRGLEQWHQPRRSWCLIDQVAYLLGMDLGEAVTSAARLSKRSACPQVLAGVIVAACIMASRAQRMLACRVSRVGMIISAKVAHPCWMVRLCCSGIQA